ncbi:MAG: M15 family metallopeptidase [Hyphomicrobiaceae bacterium]
MRIVPRVAIAAIALATADLAIASDRLPPDFVYLADVAPSITQDMRYAGSTNFTGAPVAGYSAAECILARKTALALRQVQQDLAPLGYALKVYDCYRPTRATRAFMAWARKPPGSVRSPTRRYHPHVARADLIGSGYISSASTHSTGTAVDLTLIRLPNAPPLPLPVADSGCGSPPDGTVDMGTGFDCFDPRSHAGAAGLSPLQRAARKTLADAMRRHGFRAYTREWWHFSHEDRGAGTLFDVAIPPRSSAPPAVAK